MTHAFEMGEDRDARLGLHARDQAFAAARHQHVDVAVEASEHHADGGTVARGNELNGGFRQAGGAQALGERFDDGAAGAQAIGAAAQDRGVARLEAQGAGVCGDVGTALIDDADHAERHPYPFDGHAVGPGPGVHDIADRVLEAGDGFDAGRHALDAACIEGQPVDKGGRAAGGPGFSHVLGIGRQNRGFMGPNGRRHGP